MAESGVSAEHEKNDTAIDAIVTEYQESPDSVNQPGSAINMLTASLRPNELFRLEDALNAAGLNGSGIVRGGS